MNELPPAPYPADTKSKGWRFELDLEQIDQSDTWAMTPSEFRPWLMMLWATSWRQVPCGSLPDNDALIAARIGMRQAVFTKNKNVLMRGWWKAEDGRLYHDTITKRVMAMLNARDLERQRKARYRKKFASLEDVPRDNNGTTTGQNKDTHGKDPGIPPGETLPEPEPEPEPETVNSNVGGMQRVEVEKNLQRASRLPQDWVPSEKEIVFCETTRPDLKPQEVADRFRDYWVSQPGAKGRKLDWAATWRNWVRNEKRTASPGAAKSQREESLAACARSIFGDRGNDEHLVIDI